MRTSARMSGAVALVATAALTLGACGSEDGGSSESQSAKPKAKISCEAKDHRGNGYDRCKLMDSDQVYVEATIGRQFEIEGFGLPKVGQKVWLVCHTGNVGNSSFGIVISQGKNLTDGDWTLGRIDGKPFAYVGQLIEVAINDYEKKADELNDKLESKLGKSVRSNSCEDNRVVVGDAEKALLLQKD